MGDKLDGRKVLVLPNSPDGLRGSDRRAAVEAEAKLLSNAIADSLDRIPMFNRDGQPVLLIDGALRVVNNQMLAERAKNCPDLRSDRSPRSSRSRCWPLSSPPG
jgi:hypothetical protein